MFPTERDRLPRHFDRLFAPACGVFEQGVVKMIDVGDRTSHQVRAEANMLS